jgi:hypothetical protein
MFDVPSRYRSGSPCPAKARPAVEVDVAAVVVGLLEGALADRDHLLEQGVVEGLLFLHQVEQARADGSQRKAREVRVQVVRAGLEVVLAQLVLDLDHLVGHEAGARHQDDKDAGVGKAHEVDVAEGRARHVRHQDEPDVAAVLGQHVRRVLHHLVRRGVEVAHLGRDGGRVACRQGLMAHQGVDVDPVTLVGGHPPRARMRVGEVTEALEVRHDVPQGGRGDGPLEHPGQRLRSDRLAGGDVELDQRFQDVSASIVESRCCHGPKRG